MRSTLIYASRTMLVVTLIVAWFASPVRALPTEITLSEEQPYVEIVLVVDEPILLHVTFDTNAPCDSSLSLDPYLILYDSQGNIVTQDDDGNHNSSNCVSSKLHVELSQGVYAVRFTSCCGRPYGTGSVTWGNEYITEEPTTTSTSIVDTTTTLLTTTTTSPTSSATTTTTTTTSTTTTSSSSTTSTTSPVEETTTTTTPPTTSSTIEPTTTSSTSTQPQSTTTLIATTTIAPTTTIATSQPAPIAPPPSQETTTWPPITESTTQTTTPTTTVPETTVPVTTQAPSTSISTESSTLTEAPATTNVATQAPATAPNVIETVPPVPIEQPPVVIPPTSTTTTTLPPSTTTTSAPTTLEVTYDTAPAKDAPLELRQEFENSVDLFSGEFDAYVPIGSTITIAQRRVVIAVTAVMFVIPAATTNTRRSR